MITLTQGLWIGGAVAMATVVAASRWQVAEARDERDAARQEVRELKQNLDRQNVRVDTWQAAASSARADAVAAQAQAASAAGVLLTEAKRLRSIKPATCADAVQRVREGLR